MAKKSDPKENTKSDKAEDMKKMPPWMKKKPVKGGKKGKGGGK